MAKNLGLPEAWTCFFIYTGCSTQMQAESNTANTNMYFFFNSNVIWLVLKLSESVAI